MSTLSPTVNLTAVQCPAVQVPASLLTKAAVYAGSANPVVAYPIPGANNSISKELNTNALQLDLTPLYGSGGAYAVARGLVISAPASGLNLNVSAGQAVIPGIVEVSPATTLAVPDNSAAVYVWLMQNGTLTYTLTTAAPVGDACFLGSCATGGGKVVSVDTSGVVYARGVAYRQTADAGVPGDTPPSGIILHTRTLGGLYDWDGSAYTALGSSTTALSDVVNTEIASREDLERRFQSLVGRLVELIGDEVITEEIADDVEQAFAA